MPSWAVWTKRSTHPLRHPGPRQVRKGFLSVAAGCCAAEAAVSAPLPLAVLDRAYAGLAPSICSIRCAPALGRELFA